MLEGKVSDFQLIKEEAISWILMFDSSNVETFLQNKTSVLFSSLGDTAGDVKQNCIISSPLSFTRFPM